MALVMVSLTWSLSNALGTIIPRIEDLQVVSLSLPLEWAPLSSLSFQHCSSILITQTLPLKFKEDKYMIYTTMRKSQTDSLE